MRAPPRGDVFISVVSKTYLIRHREELHPMTALIPNLALCNSVAIYLCECGLADTLARDIAPRNGV